MPLQPVIDGNSSFNGSSETWNIQRVGSAVGTLQADVSRIEDVLAEMRTINASIAKALDRNYDILVKVRDDVDGLEEKHAKLHTNVETHIARITAGGAAAGGGIASAVILVVQYVIQALGN